MRPDKDNASQASAPPPNVSSSPSPVSPPYYSKNINPKIAIAIILFVALIDLVLMLILGRQLQAPPTTGIVMQQELFTLSLENPKDGDLIASNKLTSRGKTLPNTTVALFTESDQELVESNSLGVFEGELTLQAGINSLIVTAYGEDGDEKSLELDIVYDEEAVKL